MILWDIIFYLPIVFILFFYKYAMYKSRVNKMFKNVKMIDGGLPIVGHIFSLFSRKLDNGEDFYNLMVEYTEDLTDDRRFWIFNFPFLLAINYNTIEKILRSQDAVEKPYFYSMLSFYSDGPFSAPTDIWRKMRKRINQTFSPKFYPQYINQVNYHSKMLIFEICSNYYKNSGQYENILPLLSKYFFDTVTCTHLGIDTKQQYNKGPYFAEDVARCTEIAYKRILQPWLHPEFTYKRSHLNQKLTNVMDRHTPFLEKLIKQSEEYQKKLDSKGNDLGWKSYSLLCEEEMKERGINITDYTIAHHSADILIGGSDTGAVALSNLLYHLGMHPEFQEKALIEIMDALQNEDNLNPDGVGLNNYSATTTNPIFYEQSDRVKYGEWEFMNEFPNSYATWTRSKMDRLRYLEMLIKESLRLCSPPLIMRYITTDLDVGDYIIPKGTNVGILIKNVQRSPLHWEKPEEFYPEHFSSEMVKKRPKYSYLPFSQGPRDCPGKLLGMYIMKCALAEIIRNFTIETKPADEPPRHKLVFMIEQVNGYQVKLTPRRTTMRAM